MELPKRCIKLLSYVGDTVLDPFMGSGSTIVAAEQTGRKGIGVDIEVSYCEMAKLRVIKEAVHL
ncbi:MAG: site-specific DNA-methyltransferase [Lachnospiraceae bacterium]|nr:site-specific DNA-methyltransferase [Lachnospiraceae bacterium]